jgi:DegV family protein with EDD domain
MPKIAIVTDSTATIPADLLRGHEIHIVPLQVIWGNETFRDGIDIQPDEFYIRQAKTKINPTTSQPSPAAFKEIYEMLGNQGFDIFSMHLSAKLSGTMDSAIQARNSLPDLNIELQDSFSISMSLGFQVLAVARAAKQGASLQECKALAEQTRQNSGLLFLLNTLEYLHRGGRIGGAQAFLGTALNLKPILEVRDGRIEALERVRTWNKATARLLEILEQQLDKRTPVRIAALHGGAGDEAAALLERARQRFGADTVSETVVSPVSPVIGVHTGPGVVGFAYLAKF